MSFKLSDWEKRRSPLEQQIVRHKEDRSAFERDRARIVHSAAFRRLQSKTQVLGISEGDFRRTRLTHSMEVAQIATGIRERLKKTKKYANQLGDWLPPRELLEAICFAHDLGHPPFGHGGERALNNAILTSPIWQLEDYKQTARVGFEGNGHTLRLLSSLEYHTAGFGLDVTRRTLLGVLKYPVRFSDVSIKYKEDLKPFFFVNWYDWKPPKCYMDTEAECVEWILEPLPLKDRELFTRFEIQPDKNGKKVHSKPMHKSLDCSIMDIADEIAYGVHDFEDGIALHLINRDDWNEKINPAIDGPWAESVKLLTPTRTREALADQLFAPGPTAGHERKRGIGSLVSALISSVRLKENKSFKHPLLAFQVKLSDKSEVMRQALQDVITEKIIKTQAVQTLEYRGAVNLLAVFRAIETDPLNLLGGVFRDRAKLTRGPELLRVIADYIAGMTDEYATKMFERVFIPRHGTIFDRL